MFSKYRDNLTDTFLWIRDHLGVILAFTAYVGSVLLANVLITQFGVVDVVAGPYTVMAPAAVYAVGFALVARDVLHELAGRNALAVTLAGIALGTLLSALTAAGPRLIVASAVAFSVSELLDLAVYTPLRDNGWTRAALASSAVGLLADSVLFLAIAFGSFAFLPGQLIGKAVAVGLAVVVGSMTRAYWLPNSPARA